MLKSFLKTDSLYTKNENGKYESKMLAELFLSSQVEDKILKTSKLKQLGETTLYVSGFFASSFKKKLVNQSYYIQVGEMVYSSLSSLTEDNKTQGIYRHFSNRFTDYVDILTEISHRVNIQKSGDILEIFDRYVDTGSKWAEKVLLDQGVYSYPLKKTSN